MQFVCHLCDRSATHSGTDIAFLVSYRPVYGDYRNTLSDGRYMTVSATEKRAHDNEMTPEIISDPVESARAAGLRYVTDARPGITRRRKGDSFTYIDKDGKAIKDEDVLKRIKSLAIPPAWTEVWISPNPRGHLQATGRDARGRKQYRYHPRWREV